MQTSREQQSFGTRRLSLLLAHAALRSWLWRQIRRARGLLGLGWRGRREGLGILEWVSRTFHIRGISVKFEENAEF